MANDNNHGGSRPGAGRKPIVDETKRRDYIIKSLKTMYRNDEEDKVIVQFITDAMKDSRNQQWFLKQILGETTTNVDVTTGGETIQIILKD